MLDPSIHVNGCPLCNVSIILGQLVLPWVWVFLWKEDNRDKRFNYCGPWCPSISKLLAFTGIVFLCITLSYKSKCSLRVQPLQPLGHYEHVALSMGFPKSAVSGSAILFFRLLIVPCAHHARLPLHIDGVCLVSTNLFLAASDQVPRHPSELKLLCPLWGRLLTKFNPHWSLLNSKPSVEITMEHSVLRIWCLHSWRSSGCPPVRLTIFSWGRTWHRSNVYILPLATSNDSHIFKKFWLFSMYLGGIQGLAYACISWFLPRVSLVTRLGLPPFFP